MQDDQLWYFAKAGKSHGPMTEHELCKEYESGTFGANDFVFGKGKTEGWVKASTVPGLCDSLTLDEEPEPEHHQVMPFQQALRAKAEDSRRAKKKHKERDKKFWDRLKAKK